MFTDYVECKNKHVHGNPVLKFDISIRAINDLLDQILLALGPGEKGQFQIVPGHILTTCTFTRA